MFSTLILGLLGCEFRRNPRAQDFVCTSWRVAESQNLVVEILRAKCALRMTRSSFEDENDVNFLGCGGDNEVVRRLRHNGENCEELL